MFTVRWKRTALDALADLWLEADDRESVTAAVTEIDRTIARDPHSAGESRSEQIRVLFVPPLGVFFEIDEPHQTVHVLRTWTF
jgi:hypothetical protein